MAVHSWLVGLLSIKISSLIFWRETGYNTPVPLRGVWALYPSALVGWLDMGPFSCYAEAAGGGPGTLPGLLQLTDAVLF